MPRLEIREISVKRHNRPSAKATKMSFFRFLVRIFRLKNETFLKCLTGFELRAIEISSTFLGLNLEIGEIDEERRTKNDTKRYLRSSSMVDEKSCSLGKFTAGSTPFFVLFFLSFFRSVILASLSTRKSASINISALHVLVTKTTLNYYLRNGVAVVRAGCRFCTSKPIHIIASRVHVLDSVFLLVFTMCMCIREWRRK